eukprot:2921877-Rhodomonas_salina.4
MLVGHTRLELGWRVEIHPRFRPTLSSTKSKFEPEKAEPLSTVTCATERSRSHRPAWFPRAHSGVCRNADGDSEAEADDDEAEEARRPVRLRMYSAAKRGAAAHASPFSHCSCARGLIVARLWQCWLGPRIGLPWKKATFPCGCSTISTRYSPASDTAYEQFQVCESARTHRIGTIDGPTNRPFKTQCAGQAAVTTLAENISVRPSSARSNPWPLNENFCAETYG